MLSKYAGLLCLTPLVLSGCAAIERSNITQTENTLAAAGFVVKPGSNAEQTAMIAKAPLNKISMRTEGTRVSYIYPDPTVCQCLYVGGQAAYGRYQQLAIQQRIADDQVNAAELNADSGFGWGPWGGFGPGFY